MPAPLVLRGLWWRRGLTAGVVVVAVLTATAAALGPIYARGAGESTLHDQLTGASWRTGLHASTVTDVGTRGRYAALRAASPAPGRLPGYDHRIATVRTASPVFATTGKDSQDLGTRLVWRDGACRHLVLVSGHCPTAAGEALMSARSFTPDSLGRTRLGSGSWKLGTTLSVSAFEPTSASDVVANGTTVRIVGTYRPQSEDDPFWFGFDYFDQHLGDPRTDAPPSVDSLFVAQSTMLTVPDPAYATVAFDYPLTVPSVRLADEGHERALVAALVRHPPRGLTVSSGLERTLRAADHERHLLDIGTLLVTLQLSLLAWLVLFQVVADAVESRGDEIALSKLRGRSPFATIRFGLAEPVTLIAVAVPVGIVLAWGVAHLLAHALFVPGTPVVLTLAPVWAGLAAFAGGLLAAGLAGQRTLTRSVLDQWRRTERRPGRGRVTAVADLVVAAAAVAGSVLLLGHHHHDGASGGSTALLTPGLLVLAVSLLGVRLLPLLCRRLALRTRGRRSLGLALAVRQVARRPAGLRLAALLAVAVGLATFGVAGETVAQANRTARAQAETGAPRVARVQYDPSLDPVAATVRADPHGRWAMAAGTWLPFGGGAITGPVLAVDSRRLARVGFRAAGGPSVATIAADVGRTAVPSLTFDATAVRVRVDATGLTGDTPPYVTVRLRTAGSPDYEVDGRPLRDGANVVTIPVRCAAGCSLVGLYWNRSVLANTPVTGTATLTGMDAQTREGWRPLDLRLRNSASWRAALPMGHASDRVTVRPGGVLDRFTNADGGNGGIDWADAALPVPALATASSVAPGDLDGRRLEVDDGFGNKTSFRVVRPARVLPVVLSYGLVMDIRNLQIHLADFANEATWSIWLGPHAPHDALARLRAAGLHLEDITTESHRATLLARQGPALALRLLLACALAAAVLAVGATAVSISAASRRRAFEISALRAVGVSRATLRRAAFTEQALLLGAAVVLGVPSGVLAALWAMPVIPQFADPTPITLRDVPHAGPPLALAAGFVVLLLVTAAVAAQSLIRIAVPSRLREGSR